MDIRLLLNCDPATPPTLFSHPTQSASKSRCPPLPHLIPASHTFSADRVYPSPEIAPFPTTPSFRSEHNLTPIQGPCRTMSTGYPNMHSTSVNSHGSSAYYASPLSVAASPSLPHISDLLTNLGDDHVRLGPSAMNAQSFEPHCQTLSPLPPSSFALPPSRNEICNDCGYLEAFECDDRGYCLTSERRSSYGSMTTYPGGPIDPSELPPPPTQQLPSRSASASSLTPHETHHTEDYYVSLAVPVDQEYIDARRAAQAQAPPPTRLYYRPEDPSQSSRNVAPPSAKIFYCPHPGCNEGFTRRQNLRSHMGRHTGTRNFSCPHQGCESTFRRRQELLRHTRSVHGGLEARPWACPEGCGRTFARHDALQRHLGSNKSRSGACAAVRAAQSLIAGRQGN
ncbi:hypothetical protein BJ742DRAFT_827636 [Cladochytrium replicatum]|nr:hypothetical protein BJ742DRAFT_827636 [Cladochytrium replicatum]